MTTPIGCRPRLTRRELVEYLVSIHGEAYCGSVEAAQATPSNCEWSFHTRADFWGLRRFKLTDFIAAVDWNEESVAFPEAARRYAARLTDAPPVVCDRLPRNSRWAGSLFLYDGWHRVQAAVWRGDTHIWAYVPLGP